VLIIVPRPASLARPPGRASGQARGQTGLRTCPAEPPVAKLVAMPEPRRQSRWPGTADLGEGSGHRMLRVVREGARKAKIPLIPATVAALDAYRLTT
jgi:hypothetical protein